jgi:hypothetical protein
MLLGKPGRGDAKTDSTCQKPVLLLLNLLVRRPCLIVDISYLVIRAVSLARQLKEGCVAGFNQKCGCDSGTALPMIAITLG